MSSGLDFDAIFVDLPKVRFPYDKSLPVRGWLIQGEKHQAVFWRSEVSYESKEHSHPYPEWCMVITGWTEVITPEGKQRYNAGDAFLLPAGIPHASISSDDYRSLDVFFSPNHLQAEHSG